MQIRSIPFFVHPCNGSSSALHSVNRDLFSQVFDHIGAKGLTVRVRWTPSHLSAEELSPEEVTKIDILGNTQADKHAGIAAKRVALPFF